MRRYLTICSFLFVLSFGLNVNAESLSLSKPAQIWTSSDTTYLYDVTSDLYDIHFGGVKTATTRFRYDPHLDLTAYDHIKFDIRAQNLSNNLALNGAFRIFLRDSRGGSGRSKAVKIPNAMLSGKLETVTIPLRDFDNGTFDFTDLKDLHFRLRGANEAIYADIEISNLTLETGENPYEDTDITWLGDPRYIAVSSGTTYEYLDPLRYTLLIHYSGENQARITARYNPAIDMREYQYLKIRLKVENIQGDLAADPLELFLYDSRWTGGKSKVVLLPKETLSGKEISIFIPISDFDNGNFLFEFMNGVIIRLKGTGPISADMTISQLGLTNTITDDGDGTPDETHSKSLISPASFSASSSSTGDFSDGMMSLNLTGWNQIDAGFRYSPDVDISGYTDLKMVVKVSDIQGGPIDPTSATITFYDSRWATGSANKVAIPESFFSGDETTIYFPLSDFDNGIFNFTELRDMVFQFLGIRGFQMHVDITELSVVGGDGSGGGSDDTGGGSDDGTGDDTGGGGDTGGGDGGIFGNIYQVNQKIIEVTLDGNVNLDVATDPTNWTITSADDPNFVEIQPTTINRFTVTLDAEDRDKNGQTVDDVVPRHTFYLTLPAYLSNDKTYDVKLSGSTGTPYYYDGTYGHFMDNGTFGPWTMKSGSENGTSRAIKINQHGYSVKATERYAYIGYWLGDGGPMELPPSMDYVVYNSDTKNEVTSGQTSERGLDPVSGEDVHEIDLSNLGEGNYYIEIDGIGRSHIFRIGSGSAYEAFYTTARGLYHQRAGIALDAQYTNWPRGVCHDYVYKVDTLENWGKDFPQDTPKENLIYLPGGWHDAGDYDRRPLHMTVVENLLILAEIFPNRVGDNTLNLPESGDGLPDVMDEALFGIKFWEALQNPDGGVRAGVQTYGHPQGGRCEDDTMPYFTYSANRWTSYKFAASAAHASRLLKNYDGMTSRSEELINKAILAWQWAEDQTETGTTSPVTRNEADAFKELNRERLSAAGELYAATDDTHYQDVFRELWPELGPPTHYNTITSLWGMANASWNSVDTTLQNSVKDRIYGSANDFINYINRNAYRNSRNPNYNIAWGSGTTVVSFMAPVILAYHFNPDQRYINAVAINADFELGAHPLGRSWVTGLGYMPPEFPLDLESMYDNIKQPVPGIPINGPFQNDRGNPCQPETYWQCLVYNGFYPEASTTLDGGGTPFFHHYSPWAGMAPMNEFTVWTDMAYTTLAYGFLYAVSPETPRDLHATTPENYPLNAETPR